MDDPCADIRALAIQSIGIVELIQECEEYDSESHHGRIEYIISRLILHLDDPYVKQRPLLLGELDVYFLRLSDWSDWYNFTDSIQRIATRHPKIFQREIEKLTKSYPYYDEISAIHANVEQEKNEVMWAYEDDRKLPGRWISILNDPKYFFSRKNSSKYFTTHFSVCAKCILYLLSLWIKI